MNVHVYLRVQSFYIVNIKEEIKFEKNIYYERRHQPPIVFINILISYILSKNLVLVTFKKNNHHEPLVYKLVQFINKRLTMGRRLVPCLLNSLCGLCIYFVTPFCLTRCGM